MKNPHASSQVKQNDDFKKRSQAEMQRRFIDLQFKRSELEKQLKRINEVLFALGREMEEYFSYSNFLNKPKN